MTRPGAVRQGALALAFMAGLASTKVALADPWIPAAGHGTVKPMVRLYSADSSFSASGFGTNTKPAAKLNVTQVRITGVTGLGDHFSLEYDFRFAQVRSSRSGQVQSNSGLQYQEIGLNYGLTQTQHFADSVTVNVITPSLQNTKTLVLGPSRWAVEPDLQLGVQHGPFMATLIAGPRFFVDGGATQLRSELDLSARATHRLTFTGSVFFVDTIQQRRTPAPATFGEDYNLLRLGIGAVYRLTRAVRPFVGYEDDIAGKGMHAGQRIAIGIAIHY
ncbi:MAG: hypothetical protein PHU07_10095 [Acidocella sp.]|nr:hypothetical protein [Acidocella sp.]